MRKPDYTQLLKVLNKQVPDRPTLFEFFLNEPLYDYLDKGEAPQLNDEYDNMRRQIFAYKNAGYDYYTMMPSKFAFPQKKKERVSTISLNDADSIADWDSYEAYKWPDPESFDNETSIKKAAEVMPEGMKLIVYGPGGVLENVLALVGYDNLCIMMFEEAELTQKIFDDVGSRLVAYYEQFIESEHVCALISNDDWGFKTQTMLSPADMRKYVFPWHKKIVQVAHRHNKPAFLHSCGQLEKVMEDVIEDMKFDGKHSFEDTIFPIEDAYEKYKGRIALLGGIDVDFVCRASPEAVAARSKAMLERASKDGGYALGTGNSVPEYVPRDAYLAMVKSVC